ncbi:MAG: type III-A CRISPR-associated protein Cas10/Csm1 [Bacteroidetes bacterium]|nr:MAG: type III-A CRISPR-associated protein Cas10/Csm1 [Bacteroidota bacterium]
MAATPFTSDFDPLYLHALLGRVPHPPPGPPLLLATPLPPEGEELLQAVNQVLSAIRPQQTGNGPLCSPFSFVKPGKFAHSREDVLVGSNPLSLEQSYLFPLPAEVGETQAGAQQACIQAFWQQLEPPPNPSQLLSLVEQYLATVPLPGQPDFSLYDYGRLSAALALCLQGNRQAGLEEDHILLIKGDLSGIQAYIFDVVSAGAAKSLKSRSFRVQVMAELAIAYLLQKLELAEANVLYHGGGNFVLLAPAARKNTFEQCRRELSSMLLSQHLSVQAGDEGGQAIFPQDSLQLFLAAAEFPLQAAGGSFRPQWEALEEALNRQRLQAWKGLDYELLFSRIPQQSQRLRRDAETAFYKKQTNELNRQQGFTIEQLQAARPYSFTQVKLEGLDEALDMLNPFSFGRRKLVFQQQGGLCFWDRQELRPPQPGPFRFAVRRLPVWTSALLKAYEQEIEEVQQQQKLLPPEQQEAEPREGEIIGFHYLGMFAKKRSGTDKLGILKMDVDHLGRMFRQDLLPGRDSLLHGMSLSRALKWFFEGHINYLLDLPLSQGMQELPDGYRQRLMAAGPDDSFRNNLYVLFSGGDDFFVVGAWDVIMEFAGLVQQAYQQFTAGRSTLSAGLILVDAKFPVSRFAQLVEAAESRAKEASPLKNRLCVFDQVVSWEAYASAKKMRNALYHLVSKTPEAERESRALIQKVRRSMWGFSSIQARIRKTGSLPLPALWKLNYYLRDVKEVNRPYVQERIIEPYESSMMDALQKKRFIPPAFIAIGARWAELMSRNVEP